MQRALLPQRRVTWKSAILFYAQGQALQRGDYLLSSRKGGHITKQWADQIDCRPLGAYNCGHAQQNGCAINLLGLRASEWNGE